MELTFLGAAERVTGSCYLVRMNGRSLLLDCGQFQGKPETEKLNFEPLPVAVQDIDAVVLSHAHIDHSGRLPLLKKQGWHGPIYAHEGTRDLCAVLLRDSGYLHEKDAEWENRKRARKGLAPVSPLYTQTDGEAVLENFIPLQYAEQREILPGVRIRLSNAGHILGSCVIELWLDDSRRRTKLAFSGDLGYRDAPIMYPSETIDRADLVLLESTYGDRLHRTFQSTVDELRTVFEAARAERGNVIIPAFAVGRTQDLLHLMNEYFDEWGIGNYRVFLDSPLAIAATEAYAEHGELHRSRIFSPDAHAPILERLTISRRSEDSMAINRIDSGAIIIAGSGMCNGGRVLHHLKHNVWRPNTHVVIVGFQAYGTLGRRLVDGADEIRLWGEEIRVNAAIHTVGGLSAHGDQADLIRWYGGFENHPDVCLVHGEPSAQQALASALRTRFGANVRIPKHGESIGL